MRTIQKAFLAGGMALLLGAGLAGTAIAATQIPSAGAVSDVDEFVDALDRGAERFLAEHVIARFHGPGGPGHVQLVGQRQSRTLRNSGGRRGMVLLRLQLEAATDCVGTEHPG